MLQTIILFIIQLVSIYVTVKYMEKNGGINDSFNLYTLLKLSWFAIITMPLLEESLFRCTIKSYLIDIPYGQYITSILFGLAHMENYLIHNNINYILFQIACTTYLGYYLFQFDNFIHAYLVHAAYNAFIMYSSYLVFYLNNIYKNNDDGVLITSEGNSIISGMIKPIDCVPIYWDFRCPDITQDDMIKCNKFKYIKYDKMEQGNLERYNKLKNIMFKKKYNSKQYDINII